MYYLKFGENKKFIVFLHGWGADKNSFLWVKDYFEDFSLIFVDFDGFGDSPEPAKSQCVSDYAKELKVILNKFEIDELVLVGHSFGGRVAIKFAFLFQNEFIKLKLCLIDSAGIKPRRGLKYYFKVARFKCLKRKTKNNPKLKTKLEKFGSSDYKKLSPVMKQTFTLVVNEDLSNQAKRIMCETIIIWGKKDRETKMYMAKKLNKFIKNSKLFVFDGAGHFSFLDQKQEFLILLDTLARKT